MSLSSPKWVSIFRLQTRKSTSKVKHTYAHLDEDNCKTSFKLYNIKDEK